MLKTVQLALLGCVFVCTAAIMTSSSETTYSTMGGVTILLKPDSTWDYKTPGGRQVTTDLIEELGDGRLINIRLDQTWGFMEKNLRTKMIMTGLKEISVNASSTNQDIGKANAVVSKEILDKLVAQLNSKLYKGQKSSAKILDCVKQVEKVAESSEKFIETTKLWQVSASAKIGQEQIILVAECIDQLEKEAKAKADSLKAEKKKAKKSE